MKISMFGMTAAFVVLFVIASGVSSASPQKSDLTKKDRSTWYQKLKWPADCEESFRDQTDDIPDAGLRFHPLKKKQYLVEIQCYLGAYQPGFVFMFYDESKRKAALLEFRRYEREPDGRVSSYFETQLSGFPEFDNRNKELKVWFAMDDAMRAAFVEEAMKIDRAQPVVASVGGQTAPLTPAAVETQRHYLTFPAKQGVILPPSSIKLWYDNWQNVTPLHSAAKPRCALLVQRTQ